MYHGIVYVIVVAILLSGCVSVQTDGRQAQANDRAESSIPRDARSQPIRLAGHDEPARVPPSSPDISWDDVKAEWTQLMYYSAVGDVETVQRLIGGGDDVNARKRNGETALMLAAKYGHVDVVQALLQSGAQVNTMRDRGLSIFNRGPGVYQVPRAFLEMEKKGIPLNVMHNDGATALMLAARNGQG